MKCSYGVGTKLNLWPKEKLFIETDESGAD